MSRKKDLICGVLRHVKDNIFAERRRYRRGYLNVYFIKTICSKCGKIMFQERSNSRRGYQPVCSKKCHYSGKTRKLKIKKPRNDGTFHVQMLAPDHPGADRHGRVYEHRLVIEKKLGRFLKKQETVHHINMIKHDNRPSNLFVFPRYTDHFKAHGSLNKLVSELIDSGLIEFNPEKKIYERST